MEALKLAGETGFIHLRADDACAVPGYTESGNECRADVTIESWNYRVSGKVWCDKEEVGRFVDQLRRCYEAVGGTAAFRSAQGHLTFQVAFSRNGEVSIEGAFRETFAEGNELRFRIQTDQSFIGAALSEVTAC